MIGCQDPLESGLNKGSYRKHEMLHSSASGLVVKSNIPIVGPRIRFPASALSLLDLQTLTLDIHDIYFYPGC